MLVFAIVLAAGEGRRMGRTKALLPVGDTILAAHVAALMRRPALAGVIVVLGSEADRAAAQMPGWALTVANSRYHEGMLSSMLCGLALAEARLAEAVLFHPVDCPLVEPETIDRVVEALQTGARVAVPGHAGRRGHPLALARSAWGALRAASPQRGARELLQDHPEWVTYVPGDPGCLGDLDTPADYEQFLLALRARKST